MAQIQSNMAGVVLRVVVSEGDQVQSGQEVIVLESMKMEIPVAADQAGTVKAIHVKEGDFVNEGDTLLDLE